MHFQPKATRTGGGGGWGEEEGGGVNSYLDSERPRRSRPRSLEHRCTAC